MTKLTKAAFLVVALSALLTLIAFQCYDDVTYVVTNSTGEPIDVNVVRPYFAWDEDAHKAYVELEPGELDSYKYCQVCGIQPGVRTNFEMETKPGESVTLVARSSVTQQLMFKRELSFEELTSDGLIIEISDMRDQR